MRHVFSIITSKMTGVSKTVLVEFQDHSRVVYFNSEGSNDELESLKNDIENAFQDVFSTPPGSFLNSSTKSGNNSSTYVLDSLFRTKE